MKMPELKQFARLQNIEFMSTILRYATIGHVVHEEIQVFVHKKKNKKAPGDLEQGLYIQNCQY